MTTPATSEQCPALPADHSLRELLGQQVRLIWIAWAEEQPLPKPSWLKPWHELAEPDREVDRRIGERLFAQGQASVPQTVLTDDHEVCDQRLNDLRAERDSLAAQVRRARAVADDMDAAGYSVTVDRIRAALDGPTQSAPPGLLPGA